ncbi:MAG: hypothetical protein IH804_03050 [Planctomycetes bacterium]|nr:hypothetical protein [Planctomycetota bacterium]
MQLASWRNELELEAYLRLRETDDFRSDLTVLLRPTYEAVYEVYPDTWGERPDGGKRGTSAAETQQRREAEMQAAIAQAVNDFLNDDLLAAAAPGSLVGRLSRGRRARTPSNRTRRARR